MLFHQLATYFDRLEATSSRLLLIDILSELFQATERKEIDKVIYLTQGRIAPFYAPIEIGMADKMVASALANAFTTDRVKVLHLNSQKGDLGLVAQELRTTKKESRIKNFC